MVRSVAKVYSLLFSQMWSVIVSLAIFMLNFEFCFIGLNMYGLAKWAVSKLSSKNLVPAGLLEIFLRRSFVDACFAGLIFSFWSWRVRLAFIKNQVC